MNQIEDTPTKKRKILEFDIPNDILLIIIAYLNPRHVVQLSLINKQWNEICFSDFYWVHKAKSSYENLVEYYKIENSYYKFFKDTWIKKNITNRDFEKICFTKTISNKIQKVFEHETKLSDLEMPLFDPLFYDFDGNFIFAHDVYVYCLSKKDYKVLWRIDAETYIHLCMKDDLEEEIYLLTDRMLWAVEKCGKLVICCNFLFPINENVIDVYTSHSSVIFLLGRYENSQNKGTIREYNFYGKLLWSVHHDLIHLFKIIGKFGNYLVFQMKNFERDVLLTLDLTTVKSKEPVFIQHKIKKMNIHGCYYLNDKLNIYGEFKENEWFSLSFEYKKNHDYTLKTEYNNYITSIRRIYDHEF